MDHLFAGPRFWWRRLRGIDVILLYAASLEIMYRPNLFIYWVPVHCVTWESHSAIYSQVKWTLWPNNQSCNNDLKGSKGSNLNDFVTYQLLHAFACVKRWWTHRPMSCLRLDRWRNTRLARPPTASACSSTGPAMRSRRYCGNGISDAEIVGCFASWLMLTLRAVAACTAVRVAQPPRCGTQLDTTAAVKASLAWRHAVHCCGVKTTAFYRETTQIEWQP